MPRGWIRSILALAAFALVGVLSGRALATVPGVNGEILAVSGNNVLLWNPDLSDETVIATKGDFAEAKFSPDGKRIAYKNNSYLYVANADLSDPRQLIFVGVEGAGRVAWSPDGTRIAYTTDDGPGQDIHVINADGTNDTQLTSDGKSYFPDWSPDGSTIAFTRYATSPQIWLMDSNGSNVRQLLPGATYMNELADWSPDGTKLVFLRDRQSIDTVNADGTGDMTVAPSGDCCAAPVWSPDGTRIAFQHVIMESNGANEMILPFGEISDWQAVPSLAPLSLYPPGIKGSAADGKVIKLIPAGWTGYLPIQYSYDWQLCPSSLATGCEDLPDGNGVSFTLTPFTVDRYVRICVTASNTYGSDIECSTPVKVKGAKNTKYISVEDDGLHPQNTKAQFGTQVVWVFRRSVSEEVIDTSGLGLFGTTSQNYGSWYRYTFFGAGTYPYTTEAANGAVKVSLTATPASGTPATSFTITWASAAPPSGDVFDVQVKRPGASFADWLSGTVATSATFVPDGGVGTYSFRVRLRGGGAASGYSPSASISVS